MKSGDFKMVINVVGAGLAGAEACYQLIKRNYKVRLYEMRPLKLTEAHKSGDFAELVCSNSFRARFTTNAIGLLKEEMKQLDSLIMKTAYQCEVPAGGALAVDRDKFSKLITKELSNHPLVEVVYQEVDTIPLGPTIIASGPLTSIKLSEAILNFCGEEHLYFFDTVAPIIAADSINTEIVYLKSRYDKGEASYLNCPMSKEQFDLFYQTLIDAEVVTPKDYEMILFEACMPIEEMARRGKKTLLFGPMKPVGLAQNERNKPYAVVQLRAENEEKTMYNIVGFQTHLKFFEQKRLLRLIPGLENCEILRYGVMHRNTYINSPKVLNRYFQTKKREDLFFAGQLTGVEGYIESAASGLIASLNLIRYLENKTLIDFTKDTALGALQHHISTASSHFVPMNINFGLFNPLKLHVKRKERNEAYALRSLNILNKIKGDLQ